MRRQGLALMMVVVSAFLGTACSNSGGSGGDATATGGTLVFGAEGELKGFNEGSTKTSGVTTRNVGQNIFFFAAKARPDFQLDFVGLDRAPTVVSNSPQVVEWVIKNEAVWSDGAQVTSQDFKSYVEMATDKANDADVSVGYSQITKFDVINDKTFRVTFGDRPYADFATLFEGVPQAAFMKANGGWNTALNESPGPSAGPYMVDKWEKGVSLTLVRNPRWWGAKPALDSIVFRFISSSTSLIDALANNEVDLITPQANTDLLARAGALPGVRVDQGLSADWEQLTFNTRTGSPLSDPLVRRAVATAIDRQAIADVAVKPISPTARPLGNFVYMPNQPTYKAHDAAYGRADPAAARRLLEQAGWTLTEGRWSKSGESLKLTLSTTPGEPTRVEQMDLIRNQLEKFGIGTTRDDCVIACLRQRMTGPGPFDITGFAWTGGVSAASTIKAIYETGSSRNYGKWSSTRFDDLMKSAVAEANPERQAVLANQADQVLWDELPALPLYQKPSVVIVRSKFVGPKTNGGGDGVFWNSQEWTVTATK